MKHRITIAFAFTLLGALPLATAQSDMERGDEAFGYGYYKTAIDYYMASYRRQAEPRTAYKIAEAYRLSNDYDEAIRYYKTVLQSNVATLYPHCEYFLASMYRNNGQPDSALLYYRSYLLAATNEELERRASQELRACEWVLDTTRPQGDVAYEVKHLSKNVNTEYSESGAVQAGDTLLLFSSMRELSKASSKDAIDNELVLMQVFQSQFNGDEPSKSKLNDWGLNSKEKHSCNVALDPLHGDVYFTLCSNDDFNTIPCDIYVAHMHKGKWQKPKRLGGKVNLEGYSTTQPAVAYLPDSTTVLFFSSDRPGGMGGFDIWYSIIRNGKTPSDPVNLGMPVNSEGNEITPFYDMDSGRLYFSSDWHLGYGGYDVFYSEGMRDSWQEPVNLGSTLNSPANDLYFTINSTPAGTGYLTSNRRGSYFISDNTCCNDIYAWQMRKVQPPRRQRPEPEPVVLAQKGAVHHLLPIKLYFHNDEPDPKSKLATTHTTYFQTYNRYMFMRSDYKRAHTLANGNVVYDSICDAIDYFFDYDVQYNCERFEQFLSLLLEDLKVGHRVSITVEGYASPIHTSAYNQLISKRRIASIVNQIMDWKKGILTRYMGTGGGSLQIREAAYGSSHARRGVSADPTQTNRSVYSVEAAKERRIEILDYQYLEDDSSLISCLRVPTRAMHVGTYFTGEYADIQVHIRHEAVAETALDFISVGHPDCKVVGYSKITPGRDLVIYLRMDNRRAEPTVSSFLPLTLRVAGEQITQTLFLEYRLEK
ncbi:MAG: PD40 domain-containing protein [Bacteroidales bacterium]|nr:PD40 domain-containing protein [Bacteroidales bacterium]